MLLRITLTDADRERFNLPGNVEFDLARPTLLEMRAVHTQVGVLWQDLIAAINAGDQVLACVPIWLGVRRAGVDVLWDDFDMDPFGAMSGQVDEDPNSSAPDGAKTNSTKRRRTSRASTESGRGSTIS